MNRLNLHEVAEVARLANRRHLPVFGQGATSYEVGMALGLPTDEVDRLLTYVRSVGKGPASGSRIPGALFAVVGVFAFLGILVLGLFATMRPVPSAAKVPPSTTPANEPPVYAPLASNPMPASPTPLRPASLSSGMSASADLPATIEPANVVVPAPAVRVVSDETVQARAVETARRYAAEHPAAKPFSGH